VDGGCNNQSHKDAYGSYAIFERKTNSLVDFQTFDLPYCSTNNEAEYGSMIKLLERINELNEGDGLDTSWTIKCDSKLVVMQLEGYWDVKIMKAKDFGKFVEHAKNLRDSIPNLELHHVRRNEIVKVLGH
jgi:ribonuclease HI